MTEQGRVKSWQMRDRLTRDYQLPSCGWLYGDQLPDGIVTMSGIRGEDEEIIGGAGEGAAALPVLRDKLQQLVDLKGLPYDQLLFSDWLALLFNYFAFSYGSDMAFSPRCPHCKHFPDNPHVRDISSLPSVIYKEVPGWSRDKITEPFSTGKLPPYNDVITFRLLRVADQKAAETYARKGQQAGKTGDFVRSFAMARYIEGINGEPVTTFEALDYIRKGTTGETLLALRHAFSMYEPGYDMNIYLTCPKCKGVFSVRLPEDGSYFRALDSQSKQSKAAAALDDELRSGESELSRLVGNDAVAAE